MQALVPGQQVGELLIRSGALIIIEDRDLFHARVEDAPTGAQAGRRFFRPYFFYLRHSRSLCLAKFFGWYCDRRRVRGERFGPLRLIGLLAQGASVEDSACHDNLLSSLGSER